MSLDKSKPKRKSSPRKRAATNPAEAPADTGTLPAEVVQSGPPQTDEENSLNDLLILGNPGSENEVLTGPYDPYSAAGTEAGEPPVYVEQGYQAPVTLKNEDVNLFTSFDALQGARVPEEKLEIKTISKYYAKASIPNQFSIYPDTCRVGAIQFKVFRIDENDKSLDACNLFLAKAYPESEPSIVIVSIDKQFDEKKTGWVMLVGYREVTYKKIKL